MNILKIAFLLIAVTVIAASCSSGGGKEQAPPAAKVVENYNYPPEGAIWDRVYAAPDFVMEYFEAFDKDIIPEDKPYKPYQPTDEEMKEIRKVMMRIPKKYVDALEDRFLGLFFIENMIGSGWADYVPGPDGETYAIIALNPNCLHMNASEWITNKEKTAFKLDDPAYDIKIDIGTDLSGFYYIFLHEISHSFDYVTKTTPCEPGMPDEIEFTKAVNENKTPGKHPYTAGYWKNFYDPIKKYDFEGRKDISFYNLGKGASFNISEATHVYDRLLDSPFVTLYGSINWMDDLAEMAAAYMSVNNFRRPWKLTVTKNGETIFEIPDILDREPIRVRIAELEKIIKP